MPIPLGILAVAGAGAAGVVNDYFWLETTVLSSNAASVTFSNLGNYSQYKHLQIRWTTRDSWSDNFASTNIRFNGDSGANYASHRLWGNGSSALSAADTSITEMRINLTAAALSDANTFSAGVTDILDFSSTSKNKTIRTLHGVVSPGEVTAITLQSGFRNNTAAITSISFSAVSNFVSGSRFSLYGIR